MKPIHLILILAVAGAAYYFLVIKKPAVTTNNPAGGSTVAAAQNPFNATAAAIGSIFNALGSWAQTAPKST